MLGFIARSLRLLLIAASGVLVVWAFADVGLRVWQGHAADRGKTKLRILYWGDNRERAIVDELITGFEATHPDIVVEGIHATDYPTKLKTMLASGDPPDAFYLAYERMGYYAEQGQLADLTDRVAAERAANPGWFEDFYPQLVDGFRWNHDTKRVGQGMLYGLPKDFTTTICYVNTDLFAEAGVPVPHDGWTWDEYAETVANIQALGPNDKGESRYGGVILTWTWVLRNHVWTFGGEYFGDDFDDVTLDDPAAIEAFGFIRRLRQEDQSVFNATGIGMSEDELFRLGRVGIIGPLGRWRVPTYRKVGFNWDVVPLPHKPGVEPVSAIATVAWAMSPDCKHPDETWELIKYLCGPEGQRMTAELGLAIPALRSVAESESFHKPGDLPEHSPLFLTELDHGRLAQNPLEQEFQRFVDEEVQGKMLRLDALTPEQASANVQRRWMHLLESPLTRPDLKPMPWGLVSGVAGLCVLLAVGGLWLWSRAQKLGKIDRTEERTGWLFVSPWIVGFLLFVLGPMILSLLLSLSKWSATGPLTEARFVGTGNYRELFTGDESFTQSIWVTVYYTLLAVPLTQIIALTVALLMNLAVKGIAWFRTMYFVPSVVSGVALVTLWITIFDNANGLLNWLARPVLKLVKLVPPDWFGTDSQWWASPALVIMALWGVGGGMVIYLAGLKSVPRPLYEAAYLDGAGPVRRLFNVTLPMISPIIFFQLVMAIIASFQIFTQAYVIRGASGGTNEDLLFYVLNLYDHAFRFHNMGYASAMAWVLFLAILTLTLLVFRGSKGLVHYEGLKA